MELCLIVQGSIDPQVRRYPLNAGRRWTAGRYTHLGGPLVEGRFLRTQGPHLDAQKYLPLDPDRVINRYHLEVGRDEQGAWVRDLSSNNGTWLNEVRTFSRQRYPLQTDDVLRAGGCRVLIAAAGPVEQAWLAHDGGVVPRLARAADEGDLAILPVLADALEEAGCADAELLAHLRAPGTHGGSCSVAALLLGKL